MCFQRPVQKGTRLGSREIEHSSGFTLERFGRILPTFRHDAASNLDKRLVLIVAGGIVEAYGQIGFFRRQVVFVDFRLHSGILPLTIDQEKSRYEHSEKERIAT
jgi:hypothetical protein